jgi:hypothetical protein
MKARMPLQWPSVLTGFRLPPKIGVPESGSYWRCIGAFRPSLPRPLIAMEPCLLVMQVKRSLSALANVITASQIRTH